VTRTYLTHQDDGENIRLWAETVEKQTGKPILVKGAALCLGEELGELEKALSKGDQAAAMDAIGDIHVAATCLSRAVRNHHLTGKAMSLESIQVLSISYRATVTTVMAGAMCEVARKGIRSPEEAEKILIIAHQARTFVRRLAQDLGYNFHECVEMVLDQLDKRLVQGYTMSEDGSAIKKSDQPTGR